MAIDTRSKRFSMLYVASPVAFSPLFEADGAVDADDRAQTLHLYGGIALGETAVGGGGGYSTGALPPKRGKKKGPERNQIAEQDKELLEILAIIGACMN